jgi:dephospho-CoA kinase
MRKVILSLIGHGGSGKTSAARYLQEHYGFNTFTPSMVIRSYAAEHTIIPQKRADYANVLAKINRKHGLSYMTDMAFEIPGERLCFDDLRSPVYAQRLQEAGGLTIAFDCPAEVRFAHVREHPDRAKYPASFEAFVQNERDDEAVTLDAGLQFETSALMATADYHVDATGSLDETLQQIDTIVRPLVGL